MISSMLANEKIAEYEARLKEEKAKLLPEIEKYSEPEDFGSDVDSLEEEADESESFNDRMAIATTLKGRVNEIDTALNRIKEGKYGACMRCRGEISEAVLDAAPESNLCANCKKEDE